MLMSVVEHVAMGSEALPHYPELRGKRVLLTGVSRQAGVDLAAAYGDAAARLMINFAEDAPELQALTELMVLSAEDLRIFHDGLATSQDVTKFAQMASGLHNGFDIVVNFLHLPAGDIDPGSDFDDVEAYVSKKLMAPCLISKIAANRMALTWTKGLVLNVVTMDESLENADIAIAGVTKAALSAMTRKEAEAWSGDAIRINAVTPKVLGKPQDSSDKLAGHADIAQLALYLASDKGAKLTGHIFEADGIAC